MTNFVNGVNKTISGTCPHGCAPSACPVCSGMGGGSTRMGERPQKAGEMSYHQCAMIGAMMRAREAREEVHENNLKLRADALKNFEQKLQIAAQKIAEFANMLSQNAMMKPVAFVISNVVVPAFNTLKSVTNFVANIGEKLALIKEKFIDIQDKLNAVFGEAKAAVDKKISEWSKAVKNKFDGLFKIFKKNNADDEDTKVDEDKRIFNLKKFINKIWKKKEDDTEN